MRFRPTNLLNPNSFMAGLYGRLSDEDRGKVSKFMESESIKNQRDYLHYTIKQLNEAQAAIPVEIFDEYYDDDYTGITFDRPNFQRMMKDLEAGKIDCILVKDFSRFGRDYIRIIKYLEKDFEIKNHQIRFVAYSDHYDSLVDKPDIGVRILLFLNEEYSRSQSHKVTTGMESMMRAGKFIGAFAPYGYNKDPKDKHHLIIDTEVCDNVREIFRMNLKEGLGVTEIAKRLNDKQINSPTLYKEKKGLNFKCGNRIHTTVYWTADTVNRILRDEKYTGTMVQHKTHTKDFKKKEMELVSKENWIKVEDTHEAIINKEDYDAVQRLHKEVPKNKNKTTQTSIFAGVLKCGDCLHSLIKHSEKYKDKVYYSHQCRVHKRDSSLCYTNRIYDNTLTDIILSDLNQVIVTVQDLEAAISKYKSSEINNSRKKTIRSSIAKKFEEVRAKQALSDGAEEKWLLGKLSDERYEQFKNRYQTEIEKINSEIHALQNSVDELQSILSNEWIKSLLKLGHVEELSREMLVEAVDTIYVYHDNRLVINYKFSQEIQKILINN